MEMRGYVSEDEEKVAREEDKVVEVKVVEGV